ncbi:adenosylcobinamide-phosphate synthase CbiB [Metabacillus sediminilitoris]|uniref:Cobalamin biosynthesis protein CobD n=1 Tax=Metabacillus sediminilitoris TaxID=2567941 RepID=A0A4S4BX59_9BACI|nr:adenosylcobinamide-phosphate synthase CbiB [Metabacillus sediminilitoris]QGQ46095.1 cobalamin biosynthesis protein CobD [Metabacillus sediminilitoris]THF79779.1 cobalamin biosynthesis protein CobD [Metabacillus sediminilitoris]
MINILLFHFYLLIAAIVVDLFIGDPKWLPHPVVMIGKAISFFDKRLNKGKVRKWKGVFLTLTIVGGTFTLVNSILYLLDQLHPYIRLITEIYLISTTIAINGLHKAGKEVMILLIKGDLVVARKRLSYIVGRDTEQLPSHEVVRGAVETVAENTVDAIIAPLCFALIGGAPLAMAYRAANTLDSMVGYKNEKYEQFGWASARLDDLVNWIPARLTAFLMWLFSWGVPKSRKWNGLLITFRDAKKHPSPNSGWPEAMTAGLLGVVLGGMNSYKGVASYRKEMGDPIRRLQPNDISKTIIYMHGTWIMFVIFIFLVTIILYIREV